MRCKELTEIEQEDMQKVTVGKFTGAGTGPGDPELMTLKVLRKILECDAIAIPVSDPELEAPYFQSVSEETNEEKNSPYLEKCVAYQIAREACPETEKKDRIFLPMPMIKDKTRLKAIHESDASAVEKVLEEGKNVIFLTLGDPTVYSTCMYVHRRLKRDGYPTEIIPGITSFCAAAARLDIPLAENRQELHILPASYEIEKSLELPGTKVLMKAGRKIGEVKKLLIEKGLEAEMVENCGMAEERLYYGAGEIPEQAGYYSLLIVKEKSPDQDSRKKGCREERRETGGRER